MKYLLLIYSNPENWAHPTFLHLKETGALPRPEREELTRQLDDLITELQESGEVLTIQALAEPGSARTIRVRDGAVLATDGPYVESREQMAGLFILDVASSERAEEIAARIPEARYFAAELRPIMHPSGQEM